MRRSSHRLSQLGHALVLLLLVSGALGVPFNVLAQRLPLDYGKASPYDYPFGPDSEIGGLTQKIVRFAITLCVIAAAIYIAIGAYWYFAAAGNAALAERGKEYIQRSIIGLLLALIAWVLLNTISPQFTQLKEPRFQVEGGGTGGGAPQN